MPQTKEEKRAATQRRLANAFEKIWIEKMAGKQMSNDEYIACRNAAFDFFQAGMEASLIEAEMRISGYNKH